MKLSWFFLSLALALQMKAGCQTKERCDQLAIGAGVFNIVKKPHRSTQIQWEYRFDVDFYHVRPLAAVAFTTTGSFLLCAGAGLDIYLGRRVVLTPSFAPGLYLRGDRGKNLHFPLQFRSAIDLAYENEKNVRFGAQFYHISNASLGNGNPGSESLIFYLALPVRARFRQ